ncbi:hypothetical protein HFN76_18500 [Rhizobium laguerreae]|uniref:hypothetical protein n=1 Tax=Rhizobium laguerreae TaxID=1076926 RepID=UPI001C8FB982|nr:hypothetical protein [Rhizobium laguerreae]MBY3514204.1 hypothetical protein [Rhizobium laguerreae]
MNRAVRDGDASSLSLLEFELGKREKNSNLPALRERVQAPQANASPGRSSDAVETKKVSKAPTASTAARTASATVVAKPPSLAQAPRRGLLGWLFGK